jgi:N6-L-threonylcarbamoyladenine synthase
MLILGVETSCDETAVALADNEGRILAEEVASQDAIHAPYRGVVPELAARQHLMLLDPLLQRVLDTARCEVHQIGLVAVTRGPGLAGALLTGLNFAKGLAYGLGVGVKGIHHIEAHIHSCMMERDVAYPALALVVSGGHTQLFVLRRRYSYELIGETKDDAVGEAYDKLASMLGLAYPGGPEIEKWAKRASTDIRGLRLPRPLLKSGDYHFSFSGLKTAVRYWLHGRHAIDDTQKAAVAKEFQDAVVEVLCTKTASAARRYGVRAILLAGGVARNDALRNAFAGICADEGIRLFLPEKRHCSDNAAMVAALAAGKTERGAGDAMTLDIDPGWRLV